MSARTSTPVPKPRRALAPCLLLLSLLALSLAPASQTRQDADARPQGLHQWGALTLFHGLPSDQVRAVAQDSEGQMWFGTDAGLARYDGRRIQTVAGEGL